MLLKNHLGHTQAGRVNHLPVEARGALFPSNCLVVGLHDFIGASNFLIPRAKEPVCRRRLVRMDAVLSIEAHRSRNPATPFKTCKVLMASEGTVHAAQPVCSCCCDNGVHHCVPPMTWVHFVVAIEFTYARGRHLQGSR